MGSLLCLGISFVFLLLDVEEASIVRLFPEQVQRCRDCPVGLGRHPFTKAIQVGVIFGYHVGVRRPGDESHASM